MPGHHDRPNSRLESALDALSAALSTTGAPWMIIGGIAVISRGVRRMTTDIDAVVQGDRVEIPALLETLAAARIEPRIEDAAAFAAENLVLLLRHEPSGVDLDISLGWSGFEREALLHRSEARFGNLVLPVARPEDLIVFKALAARAKDVEDIEALLLMHDSIDLGRVRRHVRELAELAGDAEIAAELERILQRIRPPDPDPGDPE